eukprot:CAMPEP_0179003192 /NCGR_PEP_ID=MMETSP0795-20121207/12512_1 /TAXON_ID=88552 /ORGANISM="Amoebophrya sp., Strain Ameob2" /LENGTH=94 /DNA_ID=CAMNT_0020697115 /DNA_START=106 /DNA_END=390 /DNA_ORIENTATION=-
MGFGRSKGGKGKGGKGVRKSDKGGGKKGYGEIKKGSGGKGAKTNMKAVPVKKGKGKKGSKSEEDLDKELAEYMGEDVLQARLDGELENYMKAAE